MVRRQDDASWRCNVMLYHDVTKYQYNLLLWSVMMTGVTKNMSA